MKDRIVEGEGFQQHKGAAGSIDIRSKEVAGGR